MPAIPPRRQALFAEGDFCAALQAFEQLVVLEPAKRVYKQWVGMCRVRLGGEQGAEGVRTLALAQDVGFICTRGLRACQGGWQCAPPRMWVEGV